MSTQKENSILILFLSLLLTSGLIGGGIWWVLSKNPQLMSNFPPEAHDGNPSKLPFDLSTVPSGDPSELRVGRRFVDVPNVPSGLFTYGGSTSWAPIRRDLDAAMQSALPGFRLRYTDPTTGTPGSSTGIRMLLEGQLAFAQSSRPLNDQELQQAQQRGFTLKPIPVAIEAIAIAVHPDLAVAGLTLAQLNAIYRGQITNWNQVGGPDLAITPFSRRLEDGGTVEFWVENVLGGASLGANVVPVTDTTAALRQLAATPGGLYYASAPEVVLQCTVKPLAIGKTAAEWVPPYAGSLVPAENCPNQRNSLNMPAFRNGQYPITRSLFVIVQQNGGIEQQAGEAYANLLLIDQGQELLQQAGFVRVR